MNRRAVLRVVGLSATGIAGCVGFGSEESGPTTEATTSTTRATARTTTEGAASTTTDGTTPATVETTEDTGASRTDNCPPSAIPARRRHVRSDYGLGLVRESGHRPAVTVVGDEWRSTLRTDEVTDADDAFLTETDFERFAVLVVQYTKSSGGHDLRVTDLGIDGRTVRAEVCVVADGATNDAPTANLLVRVPYEESLPTRAEVEIRTPTGPVTVASE
ncbi:hypothetical protein [Halorussus ruber]|uniref:hypothetical protein n=1 Tax=Halorussus ruber TaxID=1126238 RepID=UPI001092942F|nr:hypothetical protein [Halorussus ruber]